MWFDLWGVRDVAEVRHFFFYVSLIAQLFVLYLIAAALILLVWVLLLAVPLTLAARKSRVLHYLGLVALLVAQAWHYAPCEIS